MDKIFFNVLNTTFMISFVITAIIVIKASLKNYIESFVGGEEPEGKNDDEEIHELIDKFEEV